MTFEYQDIWAPSTEPMRCGICGEWIGRGKERCAQCQTYYDLTSDYGRELIDEDINGQL